MLRPVCGASFATGLMSGMWIQCAPRSNGTPNVLVSVKQRPPIRSLASISAKRRLAAATRRAAAMPAAPAPIIAMSTSPSAPVAASERLAAVAAEAARRDRRLKADMVPGSGLAEMARGHRVNAGAVGARS